MRALIGWGIGGTAIGLAALLGGYCLGNSGTSDSAKLDQAGRLETEQVVRDYLIRNPELVVEMQAALEVKEAAAKTRKSLETIKASADDIFRNSADAVLGNPNGKTTIVEFYDYNCGYCKRALDDMQGLVKADPELRFVLKEFPILGPDSQRAHMVAQAFHRLMPAKYNDFHIALMGLDGRATEDTAVQLAVTLGATEAALRAEMEKPEIMAAFQNSYGLADRLSITGTPSYVIGNEVVFGALGQQTLREKIAAARATCQTAAC